MSIKHILHIDINQFFVSVELLDKPKLRGKPLIVSGGGNKGVISAASYEARKLGLKSGTPNFKIPSITDHKIYELPLQMEKYRFFSKKLWEFIKEKYTLNIEQVGYDEIFLEATSLVIGEEAKFNTVYELAESIRISVLDRFKLKVNIGIGPTLFLAKMASNYKKPFAINTMMMSELPFKLFNQPIENFWGIGKKGSVICKENGINKIGDILELHKTADGIGILRRAFGNRVGNYVLALKGLTSSKVFSGIKKPKSFSRSFTLPRPTMSHFILRDYCDEMMDNNWKRLVRNNALAQTVSVSLGYEPFKNFSRSFTLKEATEDFRSLQIEMYNLLDKVHKEKDKNVRFLSVHIGKFTFKPITDIQMKLNDLYPHIFN